MITSQQLRQKYISFFVSKGHAAISTASLIPENDPTVLFTTAGMHPLVPFLQGQKHPQGTRLTNIQKCIRTGDIDEVGDNTHLTFFEMLGNWSLGDYGKKEAIELSFEFLTQQLGIPLERLAVSCFVGDTDAPRDTESAAAWQSLGIPEKRIAFLGKKDNWWGPAGTTGPCGPDTEMFYWTGRTNPPENFDPTDKNWVEIWNDVFMIYSKQADGTYAESAQKNVDTGMGLERTVAVLNGFDNVYQIDTFQPITTAITELADLSDFNDEQQRSVRIIADHLRAATFILGDEKGVEPSNLEHGYVLRRLIRRAIRHAQTIGITDPFTFKIATTVIKQFSTTYPELTTNQDFIINQLATEEERFSATLEKGLREFSKIATKNISGRDAFILFSTYGFPLEMTQELAKERGLSVDTTGFTEEFTQHQELSRTASAGRFKGGLADHSLATTRLHTATHLLNAALREVLGDHVFQKGSNITADRLRFDFSHPEKMTDWQIRTVQDLVNEQIKNQLPVGFTEMTVKQAKQAGAIGVFDQKYGQRVKVYTVGKADNPFSQELCGGPHVSNTAELGRFKIIKEEASGSGVRRIKAILE